MAAIDKEVKRVIDFAIKRIDSAPMIPAWPTTKLARMNIITPRMVSMAGVNTPPNVPKRFRVVFCFAGSGICSLDQNSKKIILFAGL